MLRHAFRFVNRVVFLIGEHNTRSRRAVEKVGGVIIAPRIDKYGRPRLAYEITAAMFEENQRRRVG
jgi:RimJ/RimL family protein N-acetyltransferase